MARREEFCSPKSQPYFFPRTCRHSPRIAPLCPPFGRVATLQRIRPCEPKKRENRIGQASRSAAESLGEVIARLTQAGVGRKRQGIGWRKTTRRTSGGKGPEAGENVLRVPREGWACARTYFFGEFAGASQGSGRLFHRVARVAHLPVRRCKSKYQRFQ